MMAASSSSNLSDHHVVQDDLPWPPPASSSSSLLPFAPAPHHSAIVGANQLWCQQPLTLNCADRNHCEELEVLLSAQGGHHHSHSHPSPVIPFSPQLSSLLMMQDLAFQWSNNCSSSFLDTSSSVPVNNDGHNKIKEENMLINSSRSSCASTAIAACHDDIVVLDGGGGGGGLPSMAVAADLDGDTTVLPSVNISRTTTTTTHQRPPFLLAAPPPLPGDAFEILASSRLCKTLLLSQGASSVLLHNGSMPFLRSEHVPYGPPAAAAHPHGPSIDNYKQQMGASSCVDAAGGGGGGGRHWSAEHDAACQSRAAARPAPSAPSSKKPRVEQRTSTTIVPSFKVRKEKLGDRIAALQQLVSPFGKTDTASVLMEAIGYIKFLQDQVETLSRPYLKSSRSNKPKPTTQRGCSNANAAAGEKQEETRVDLRSRGLCLVPLSCTSYVTNENGLWVPPNFRGN